MVARPTILGGPNLPSSKVVEKDITGSFTGLGTSPTVTGKGTDVSISGTFTATVVIERLIGGTWQVVESLTAPAERFIESERSRQLRVRCSAYTSGTVNYALET